MPQRNYGQIVAQKNPKVLTAEPYVFNESLRCVIDEQSIHRLNRSGHNIARENHAACPKIRTRNFWPCNGTHCGARDRALRSLWISSGELLSTRRCVS